jgi:hypothetical protein
MARPRTEPAPETETGFPALADVTPGPLALTGLNQPLWLQNSTYPAAIDRQLIAAGLEPGVLGLNELAVSQRAAGANYSVDVAAGRVVVPMTDAPNQGSALAVSTAVNNLVIAGAPGAGLSRIDLVIARVYDASLIGGSVNGWQLEVVTGTPASTPAAPALPASSLELARVAVAAAQASVTTANITDRRVMPGIWRPYTPVWTSSITNPGLGNGTITGRYLITGKTCSIAIRVNFGSSTTGGQGFHLFSLPVAAANIVTGVMEGSGQLYVPPSGLAWPAHAYLWDANRLALVVPITQSDVRRNYWATTDATNGAGAGNPNVSPAYNVQSGGYAWLGATYETT